MFKKNFIFDIHTKIIKKQQEESTFVLSSCAVSNVISILERDMKEAFLDSFDVGENEIQLIYDSAIKEEAYRLEVTESKIKVVASDELGFAYALLEISRRFLGKQPFGFWMNQKLTPKRFIEIEPQVISSPDYAVRFRGWFFNDEVLLSHWNYQGDNENSFRMAYETLLRCGGNMVISGTDLMGIKMRKLAADMGLYITHHHAEPLGAEMFARAYPNERPNYKENKELFLKLWEEAIDAQKDQKTIYALGFRGQGDCPFWSNDDSGDFDTDEKRGALISELIRLQRKMVEKKVKHPIFCTNLYGEIMELYDKGCLDLDEDIIKIYADNGFGKMVTRRRDNHLGRVKALPKNKKDYSGIYYHVSFYDLQAANHLTMLPNSVDFLNRELDEVLETGANKYWLINCSNVLPHVYYLDAVRRKWLGEKISDEEHSRTFTQTYYAGNEKVAGLYAKHADIMPVYGPNEDEHAGEQFYTENARIVAWHLIRGEQQNIKELNWCTKEIPLDKQMDCFADILISVLGKMEEYVRKCEEVSGELEEEQKKCFRSTLYLDAQIHMHCAKGMLLFTEGVKEYLEKNYMQAFHKLGMAAKQYETANQVMRNSEYGAFEGFFENDCFADIKHTAYMIRKLMGTVREYGDNIRHDSWYRELLYKPEERQIFTQLVLDNHMTDEELWNVMEESL